MSPPHVSMIHEVIMEQREVMIGFQTDRWHHNALRIILVQIIGEQHENRTHALTTNREHILDRFIQSEGLAVIGQVVERCVDLLQ